MDGGSSAKAAACVELHHGRAKGYMSTSVRIQKRGASFNMADPLMLTNLQAIQGADLVKLQKGCLKMLGLPTDVVRFPGSQPVSFERTHLAHLAAEVEAAAPSDAYFAAEKTDGMRYMLMIAPRGEGAFVIDRKFQMRRLPVQFPSKTPGEFIEFTLLDGELVEDTDLTTGRASLRYLIYDACIVNKKNVTAAPLTTRLWAVRNEVLRPWFATVPFDENLFRIELKDQFAMGQLEDLFTSIEPSTDKSKYKFTFTDTLQTRRLLHGTDGIIFTPVNAPYVHGTDKKVLKWKPAEMNSIDFAFNDSLWLPESSERGPTPRFIIMIAQHGVLKEEAWLELTSEEHARLNRERKGVKRNADVIIECVWDPTKPVRLYDRTQRTWEAAYKETVIGGWSFERVRADKDKPNEESTVKSVKDSIKDNVTKEELVAAFSR